jgi:membrane glycosyltransferase
MAAADHALGRRRLLFASAVVVTFGLALLVMARTLGADGLGFADFVLLACFAAMLPWNVIGFWNAVVGFAVLAFARDPTAHVFPAATDIKGAARTRARLALVMPIHDEAPARVIRHLGQTVASLLATRVPLDFEVFLLSDTQREESAAAERAAFDAWHATVDRRVPLHYRRRAHNQDHKTGNIWDFLERHGARFDLMLVLDADSVMTGDAIVRLMRIMAARPRLGILQQLIVGLPNLSPFPRIFQFGMRHGMRAYSMGGAWWQGDCGPYWGHNAMVRVAPFMEHCRLPTLPGGPPLGGRILSHDQVEATLMRRAGWEVRVLTEESGSFEENPPTLPDFVKRDLRWCQGNWQYLRLLGQPGLHAMGRLQLWLAILMYVSGPAWILFSLVGFGAAIGIEWGATGGVRGPPALGRPAPWEPWALLIAMMTIVFAPKLAGVVQVMLYARLRRRYGGVTRLLGSAVTELLFSFVLAPIMAVAQSVFLLGLAAGRVVRWEAQLRDSRALPWGEAMRGLWPQTLLGLLVGVAVGAFGPPAARIWAVLFCGPLILAVPFAVMTSWTGLGRGLARLGLCSTPEEIDPPEVVIAAGHVPRQTRRLSGAPGLPEPASAAPPVE